MAQAQPVSTATQTGCRRTRCRYGWRSARTAHAAPSVIVGGIHRDADMACQRKFAGRCARCRYPHTEGHVARKGGCHAHSCASRRTACRATERVAKSGGDPVRRSTTIRLSISTGRRAGRSIRRPGAGVPAPAMEHGGGDLALQGVEVVAHGAPRGGLPLTFDPSPSICSLIQVSPMRSPSSK